MVVLGGWAFSYWRGTPAEGLVGLALKTLSLTHSPSASGVHAVYRGTSPITNSAPLGPYRGNMPRALWWSQGGRQFLMSEVPLQLLLGAVCFLGGNNLKGFTDFYLKAKARIWL